MEVGTRVRYICKDIWEELYADYYPPAGTLGTVERVDSYGLGSQQLLVQWDSGTKGDGRWWCDCDEVEVVKGEKQT